MGCQVRDPPPWPSTQLGSGLALDVSPTPAPAACERGARWPSCGPGPASFRPPPLAPAAAPAPPAHALPRELCNPSSWASSGEIFEECSNHLHQPGRPAVHSSRKCSQSRSGTCPPRGHFLPRPQVRGCPALPAGGPPAGHVGRSLSPRSGSCSRPPARSQSQSQNGGAGVPAAASAERAGEKGQKGSEPTRLVQGPGRSGLSRVWTPECTPLPPPPPGLEAQLCGARAREHLRGRSEQGSVFSSDNRDPSALCRQMAAPFTGLGPAGGSGVRGRWVDVSMDGRPGCSPPRPSACPLTCPDPGLASGGGTGQKAHLAEGHPQRRKQAGGAPGHGHGGRAGTRVSPEEAERPGGRKKCRCASVSHLHSERLRRQPGYRAVFHSLARGPACGFCSAADSHWPLQASVCPSVHGENRPGHTRGLLPARSLAAPPATAFPGHCPRPAHWLPAVFPGKRAERPPAPSRARPSELARLAWHLGLHPGENQAGWAKAGREQGAWAGLRRLEVGEAGQGSSLQEQPQLLNLWSQSLTHHCDPKTLTLTSETCGPLLGVQGPSPMPGFRPRGPTTPPAEAGKAPGPASPLAACVPSQPGCGSTGSRRGC